MCKSNKIRQGDREKSASFELLLNQAFGLAYFLVENRETALRIVTDALMKLETAAEKQDKRLYYQPTANTLSRKYKQSGSRSKVLLGSPDLFQYLIYLESESHVYAFKSPEESLMPHAPVDEARLLIHFIKYLVMITLTRNSFYVTLGLTRLLYNYSTTESLLLHHLVMQTNERAKDESYWRARKAQLMRELKDRFGNLLSVTHGRSGEERFQAQEDSSPHAELVKECLRMFTPWSTTCPLPSKSPQEKGRIESLAFRGNDPDAEHQVEVARMHAIIHPDCFERLVAILGLPAPAERLEIPRVCLLKPGNPLKEVNEANPVRHSDSLHVQLTDSDLRAINDRLDQ